MKYVRIRALFVTVLLASLLAAAPSAAAVSRWNTNSNGSFTVATNWDNGVPGVNDVAYFGRGNAVSYTVTFPTNPFAQPVNQQLLIGPNTVQFSPPPFSLTATTYTVNLNILLGEPGSNSVLTTTLTNLATPSAFMGAFTGSTQSTLNVNDGRFTIFGSSQTEFELNVGHNSQGTVNVAAGAVMNLTGAESNAVLGAFAGIIGTVNVSGTGATWNNLSDSETAPLVIGAQGTGALNITAGGSVNDGEARVGRSAGSTGSVVVADPGSIWANRGLSMIGVKGHGELFIGNGARVDDDSAIIGGDIGGAGAVEVTGAGSTWDQLSNLNVGENLGSVNGVDQFGLGTLEVAGAGQVNTGGDAGISGPTSKATVEGVGSIWNVGGELAIDSAGALDVKSGGTVNSNTAFVGIFKDGTATVSGAGATWNIADVLSVARTNTGTLNVTGGGRLTSRLAFLGVRGAIFSQSSALVQVDGVGSSWTDSEQIFVGYEGHALLLVTGGAHVTCGTGQIGFTSAGDGSVHVVGAGSRWTNTESLYVGVVGTGDLQVAGGGTVVVDGLLSIGPRGNVQGNSTIAAEVRNGGTVAPGVSPSFVPIDSIGTLQINGDYTQTAAGDLAIQLASTTNFDKLNIDGHANLAGTLKLSLFGGFMPAVGNMFQILTANNGITGKFDLEFTSLSPGTSPGFIVLYSNSDVVLKFVNFLSGDFNHDGAVDVADYVVWRNGLGTTFIQDDYNLWRSHFGQTAGSGSGATGSASADAAVPEPVTWQMAMLAIAMVALCKKYRDF